MLSAAFSTSVLAPEEEADLLKRWLDAGDPSAMRRLVESHGRLVVRIASNYLKLGLPLEDLVQEGLSGLVQAIHRFDPNQGCRLSTYARWSIRAAIQAFILRNWSSVRLTKAEQEAFFASHARARQRALNASTANSNRSPRLASRDKAAEPPVGWCVRARDLSLNAPPLDDEGPEPQDLLCDERPSPEDTVIDALDRQNWHRRLEAALDELSAREQTIIKERHLREDGLGLKELGENFGVSKESS